MSRQHRIHAELGYALKDQTEPDYVAAKAELEKAIEVRPPAKAKRLYLYEYNLAYCEIALDKEGFGSGRESADALVKTVTDNLAKVAEVAAGMKTVRRQKDKDEKPELVFEWMQKNSQKPAVKALQEALAKK